jgi:thiamine-phosphate pyrophosphorylase
MAARCLVYYITDRTQFHGTEGERRKALLNKVAEAARAGVDYIQLREKDLSGRELESLAKEARNRIREERRPADDAREPTTRLLINSRTDVALAAGADGVHLRSDDISPRDLRRMLELAACSPDRDRFLIAASGHTAADVTRAEGNGADFAVFAPVFEKHDHPNTPPAGLGALRRACQAKIPVLALGGVTLANAASCREAGAAGIAGIRLFQENKIEDVVRALRTV